MSLVTQLVEGKIGADTFVSQAGSDLLGYLKRVQTLPGVPQIEQWLLTGLGSLLAAKGVPMTVVEVVLSEVQNLLNAAKTPTPAA